MYKLTSLIKLCFITGCILTNLMFFFNLYLFLCDTYVLKILFCYLLYIYCNELNIIYPNDLIFKRLNSNKAQHQISLQKTNGI